MRKTGLVGTDPVVQRDLTRLFIWVSAAYRRDIVVMAMKRMYGAE
jgi:hypothetical protein